MTFHQLNTLPPDQQKAELFRCCGSTAWVNRMIGFFPMDDLVELLEDAEQQWYECTEADWMEAFSHHPKIGGIADLKSKFSGTADLAGGEQASVMQAPDEVLSALAAANEVYEKKFGYTFIVSATGKTAGEMLSLLQQRLPNTPAEEINVAMEEQNKITLIRLQKLIQ